MRDRSGRERVITGDHFYRNAGFSTAANGGTRFRSRRIHHSLQSKKGQIARHVVMVELTLIGRRFPLGKGEDTQSFRRHLFSGRMNCFPIDSLFVAGRIKHGRATAAEVAKSGVSPTTELAKLFTNIEETGGWDGLVELIYNTTASFNGFDQYGHFGRTLVTLSNCLNYIGTASGTSGCAARFNGPNAGEGTSSSASAASLSRLLRRQLTAKTGGTVSAEGPATGIGQAGANLSGWVGCVLNCTNLTAIDKNCICAILSNQSNVLRLSGINHRRRE